MPASTNEIPENIRELLALAEAAANAEVGGDAGLNNEEHMDDIQTLLGALTGGGADPDWVYNEIQSHVEDMIVGLKWKGGYPEAMPGDVVWTKFGVDSETDGELEAESWEDAVQFAEDCECSVITVTDHKGNTAVVDLDGKPAA